MEKAEHYKTEKFILTSKEILTFVDIETEKNKFYHYKYSIFKKDVDIKKVLVSNKVSFVKKIFIDSLYNDHKVKTLYKVFSKTSAYLNIYYANLNGYIF